MSYVHPAWLEYQLGRYERHDAHRFTKPESVQRTSYSERMLEARHAEELAASEAEQESLSRDLAQLRWLVADLKLDLAIRRLRFKALHPSDEDPSGESENPAHHSNSQPRVPAGSPDGGQWTEGSGSTEPTQLAQVGSGITDAFGQPYYQRGGHHELTREVFGKWQLHPETRSVFEQSTTGSLPRDLIRTTPDGRPIGHFWDGRNGAHGVYNQAIRELSDDFLNKNSIKPSEMTPDHAKTLLKEIRESNDPRIRGYNDALRLLRRLRLFRTGRGTE